MHLERRTKMSLFVNESEKHNQFGDVPTTCGKEKKNKGFAVHTSFPLMIRMFRTKLGESAVGILASESIPFTA